MTDYVTPKQTLRHSDDQIHEVFYERLHACRIAECDGPNGSTLQFYNVDGVCVIVQRYAGNNGWTHYLGSKTPQIEESIKEIQQWVAKVKKPATPEEAARRRLKRAINRFVRADVAFSWRGSQPAEEIPYIEREWIDAHTNLIDTMNSMHISETLAYWHPTEDRPKTAAERKRYQRELAKLGD